MKACCAEKYFREIIARNVEGAEAPPPPRGLLGLKVLWGGALITDTFFQLINFILKIFKLTKLSHHLIEELLFYNILAKPCAERPKYISKSQCQMALLFKH